MAELVANILTAADGTVTTLFAAITTTDGTSITTSGPLPASLRSGQCRLRIGDELMVATVNGSGIVTSITRGAEESTAATHPSGSRVRHVLTAGALAEISISLETLMTALGPIQETEDGWPERPTLFGQEIPWSLKWRSLPGGTNNPVDLMSATWNDEFFPIPEEA